MNNEQPQNNTTSNTPVSAPVPAPSPATAPAPAPAPAAQPIATMTSWPGAFGIYKQSKQAIMLNIKTILVLIVLGIVWAVFDSINLKNFGLSLVQDLVNVFLNVAFTTAFTVVCLLGVKNETTSFSQVVNKSKGFLLNIFLSGILVGFAYIGSILLFLVPFFFVFPRLVLAPYLIVDKNMNAIDSFVKSWEMSKGHVGKVYGIVGATLAMALLAITIIGIPFSIYFVLMYSAATAVLYIFISNQPVEAAKPAGSQIDNTQEVTNETPKELKSTEQAPVAPAPSTSTTANSANSNELTVSTDSSTVPKL